MTHEEIESAIMKLRSIEPSDYVGSAASVAKVVWAWMGGTASGMELRDTLIDLLKQANHGAYIELPKDRDDMPIHIGDELCGYGRPDGGVYCKATNGYMVFVGEDGECAPKQWMVWDPDNCAHYHKPTIEDVLREMIDEAGCRHYPDGSCEMGLSHEQIADYARRISEMIADE